MRLAKSGKTKNPSIRALTIRQPWAELILRGRKPFELRSWKTKYRGPLVIHAAMRVDSEDARQLGLNPEMLTTGSFVGVAVLSDVRPFTGKDARLLSNRRAGGSWYPNLFSWVLVKPRRISPVKAKGKLGLFKVPGAVERRIARLHFDIR
jgi:ASCH domain